MIENQFVRLACENCEPTIKEIRSFLDTAIGAGALEDDTVHVRTEHLTVSLVDL